MSNFEQFGLPNSLLNALKAMQITTPTAIQEATIPVAMAGKDILASAQTGSGKTIAYSIPLLIKLFKNPRHVALILTPTRELAAQVHQALMQLLGPSSQFKSALLIGGAPMFKQMNALRRFPQLIVGTPGRITDHLLRGTLNLKDTRFLVIDEADRMLDMGFGIQLDKIAEFLPESRQTLMFSATLPPNIDRLSKKYLITPQRITIQDTVQSAPKIKQEVIQTTNSKKLSILLEQLNVRTGSVIIFTKTKLGADRLCEELKSYGHTANAIHGDLNQRRRDSVILGFRNNKNRILVATDLAARGLDIPHIMHVINYDLPQCPEDYVHRIGRTARAGAEGNALCFVSPNDGGKWRAICKLMNPGAAPSVDFAPSNKGNHKFKKRPFKQGFSNKHSKKRFSKSRSF